jgi:hypothetical protein
MNPKVLESRRFRAPLLARWENAGTGPSERGRGVNSSINRLVRAKATVDDNVLSGGEGSARRT